MGSYIRIGAGRDGAFRGYLARAETPNAPSVVVLHEVFGVNDEMRQTCDDLAETGFTALCPDLFWRQRPGLDLNVRSSADWETGLRYYATFDRDLGVKDIAVAAEVAARQPGASGRVALLRYCLGGLMAFLTAARSHVDAAVAFHGADTEKYLDEAVRISIPMMFHLAGEDEFMPFEARRSIAAAFQDRPDVQVHCYSGCHHAFSRHGGLHYQTDAARLANERTWAFLGDALRVA